MTLQFACGHGVTVGDAVQTAPLCWCGESRIQSVSVRAPRFRGTCSGPLSEYKNLEPAVVNVAPGGPLQLQPPKE